MLEKRRPPHQVPSHIQVKTKVYLKDYSRWLYIEYSFYKRHWTVTVICSFVDLHWGKVKRDCALMTFENACCLCSIVLSITCNHYSPTVTGTWSPTVTGTWRCWPEPQVLKWQGTSDTAFLRRQHPHPPGVFSGVPFLNMQAVLRKKVLRPGGKDSCFTSSFSCYLSACSDSEATLLSKPLLHVPWQWLGNRTYSTV